MERVMDRRRLSGPGMRVVAVPLVVAATLIGLTPGAASAATCVSWTGRQPPNPSSISNTLSGVAVASSCRAWAVGYYDTGGAFQTLIARWNGTSWAQQTSPNPGDSNFLNGAAAISTSNVWAVGHYVSDAGDLSLIEHWNGTTWKQVPSPQPELHRSHPVRCGRRLRQRCLGGRLLRQRWHQPDLDRALERHGVDEGAQPKPEFLQQHSFWDRCHLRQQHLGSGPVL